jgi:hypothetical protein
MRPIIPAAVTRRFSVTALVLILAAGPACASDEPIEINYRLRPDRDLTAESVADAITTTRVLVDRGIVAKSGGRLSSRPTTVHIVQKHTYQYITGSPQADGSFTSEMRYLDKTTSVRGPDGQEQNIPERVPLKGVRVLATVDADGKLRPGSTEVTGIDARLLEPFRQSLVGVLSQFASIPPLVLTRGQSVPQEMSLQVPVPGIANLQLKMQTANQLLDVEGGVARIQQIYSLDFGIPSGSAKITAEGSGGGSMLYQVSSQTLLSSESGMLMKLVMDTADGVIEMQLNSRQVQKMWPTAAGPG